MKLMGMCHAEIKLGTDGPQYPWIQLSAVSRGRKKFGKLKK